MKLTQGQRSIAVRRHNRGETITTISEAINAPADDVWQYLRDRPGYPSKIVPLNVGREKETASRARQWRQRRKDSGNPYSPRKPNPPG